MSVEILSEWFSLAQQWLFESVVQPLLFGLGGGSLLEDAFDATGWLLVGLIQLAVMLALIGPLQHWRPVQPIRDRRAVRIDVIYTLIERLGLFRVAMFFAVDPLWDELWGWLAVHGNLATGTVTPLAAGASYDFVALTVDDINDPRFLLHASAPLQLATTQPTCNGHADGSASLAITNGPVDVTWTESDGDLLLAQTGVMPGTTALQALRAGVYHVRLEGSTTWGSIHTFFTITEPPSLEVEATTMPSTCPDSEDGSIDITVIGGQAPYTYQWSNEADTDHLEVAVGTYTVLITDANGCTFAPQAYVVGSGEGPDAGIGVAQTLVQVGEEVLFVPNTMVGVENTWHFGDGHTSNALEAVHSYNAPGTYSVTLTVDNSQCISTTTLEIQVEPSTGIANTVGRNLNAFVSGDHIVIDHDFSGPEPVVVRLYSTGGQLAQEHQWRVRLRVSPSPPTSCPAASGCCA